MILFDKIVLKENSWPISYNYMLHHLCPVDGYAISQCMSARYVSLAVLVVSPYIRCLGGVTCTIPYN